MEWRTVRSEPCIDSPYFRVRRDDVELPSGDVVPGYHVWESKDIATVVPVTPGGEFVLVRQWRHGTGQLMLQFPAGGVDAGETALEAARRELREETGYLAGNFVHLGDTSSYPTKMTGWSRLFLAEDAYPGAVPADDPMEQTEIVVVDAAGLRELIETNQFQVADSLAAALLTMRRLGL
ncbi:NUDIX hydrolase [Longispora albida]|uniref:NUDIX hydrolase n=1 Tax=Longispora albida TaxID=203523 RepID=UPI00058CABCA|nr:NUDIX hydrolase [Longispora albida]